MLLKPTVDGRVTEVGIYCVYPNALAKSTNNALIDFLGDYVFSQACCLKDQSAGRHLQYCKACADVKHI